MRLFDTHCHLQASVFDGVRDRVKEEALAAEVAGVVCCSTSPQDWEEVKSLSLKNENWMIPAYGVHPWYAPPGPPETWLPPLEAHLTAQPQAWVGEIGIDQTTGPDLSFQEQVFVPQLHLAGRMNRPASIHCRKTWDRLAYWLRRRPHKGTPVVIHSFSGSWDVARDLVGENVYFSFSGSLTNPRNQRLPRVLAQLPRDRVLMETDSPDILPYPAGTPQKAGPNTPSRLVWVLKAVTQVWGGTLAQTAEILERNTTKLAPFWSKL